MRRAAAAAALLLAALPATAHATDYGGGTAASSPRGLALVSVRTAADGTARVSVTFATRCYTVRGERTARLAPDGTFALDFRVRGRVRDLPRNLRQSTRIRVSGTVAVLDGTGTVEVNARLRRDGRTVERCDPAARTWHVRASRPLPAVAGAPRPDGSYHGLTSQAAALALRVDPSGERVRLMAFAYSLRCREGTRRWENVTPGAPVAQYAFRLRERFSFRWREGRERYRVVVDGGFGADAVTGSIAVTSVLRAPSGRVVDRCRTGPLTFFAVL